MAETAGSGDDDNSAQLMSIHEAARNRNVSQLRRALTAVSPNFTNETGQSAIHLLCYNSIGIRPDHEGRMACLGLLQQSPDFDVHLPDQSGFQAIQYVACHARTRNDVEFMQAVLDA